MKNDGGKGSSPRPFDVDQKTFSSNWDNIDWGKKEEPKEEDTKEETDENLR